MRVVTLIESIVVRVMMFPHREIACMSVPASNEFMSFYSSNVLISRDLPSHLITRWYSLAVRPLLGRGGFGALGSPDVMYKFCQ